MDCYVVDHVYRRVGEWVGVWIQAGRNGRKRGRDVIDDRLRWAITWIYPQDPPALPPPDRSMHFKRYISYIRTRREAGRPVKCSCARDGSGGKPTGTNERKEAQQKDAASERSEGAHRFGMGALRSTTYHFCLCMPLGGIHHGLAALLLVRMSL